MIEIDDDLPKQLAEQIKSRLPGRPAQEKMAPVHCQGRHFKPAPSTARQAAVILLLYQSGGEWYLPVTVRAAHLKDHAGQISLPGGRVEPGESVEQAAIRELHEELGVAPNGIETLGSLSSIFLYVSNFNVTPIVAWRSSRPVLRPDPGEVAEVIELPLAALLDSENYVNSCVEIPEIVEGPDKATVPTIKFGNHEIWGATAIMLAEFVAVIHEL